MTAASDDTAAEARREIRSLLSAVSHDLRAPLRAIDGFAQALEEDCADRLDPAGADYLRRIRAAARRMDRMLAGLITLGRLVERMPEPDRTDISHIAGDLSVGLRERDATHRPAIAVDPGIVGVTDHELVRLVLQELLANAWKFTRGVPEPRIALTREPAPPGHIAFAVRDNGAGFDAARAGDKLFGLFQRFHTEDTFPGDGVGLALARRAVLTLGGGLRAESASGNGAAFFCVIPIAD